MFPRFAEIIQMKQMNWVEKKNSLIHYNDYYWR